MKRILSLLLATALSLAGCALLLAGCGSTEGESSSSQDPRASSINTPAWEAARKQLPRNLVPPQVVPSQAAEDPVALAAAGFIADAMAAYPHYPQELGPDSPADNLLLLATGVVGTGGTQLGQPGTEGEIFRQVDKILNHPGGFITKEQVEAAARRLDPDADPDHQSVWLGDAVFSYREDLGVYLYPTGEVEWYAPLLLSYIEDADGSCWAEVALVRPASEWGEACYTWQGELMGVWEMEEEVLGNPAHYPRYEVELLRSLPEGEDSPSEAGSPAEEEAEETAEAEAPASQLPGSPEDIRFTLIAIRPAEQPDSEESNPAQ